MRANYKRRERNKGSITRLMKNARKKNAIDEREKIPARTAALRYLRGERDYDGAARDLSCDRSKALLALREIIARGRARSRAVFDCGKLAAAVRKAPAEEHRRTSCIMCKSWPPVPIIISLLFLLGSFYFAPWT